MRSATPETASFTAGVTFSSKLKVPIKKKKKWLYTQLMHTIAIGCSGLNVLAATMASILKILCGMQ